MVKASASCCLLSRSSTKTCYCQMPARLKTTIAIVVVVTLLNPVCVTKYVNVQCRQIKLLIWRALKVPSLNLPKIGFTLVSFK